MRKIAAWALLICLLPVLALGEGACVSFVPRESDVWPQAALNALGVLLSGMELNVSADDTGAYFALDRKGEMLLRGEVLESGGAVWTQGACTATEGENRLGDMSVCTLFASLGDVLKDWEKSEEKKIELERVGTIRSQLVYVLAGEEWAQMWPQVMEKLTAFAPQLQALENLTVGEKGTLKRYFLKDGTEIGGYFYAAEVTLNGEKREARLEWGYIPDKGLYIAFRCPNARDTRNVRIAVRGWETEKNGVRTRRYTADVRIVRDGDSAVYTLEGKFDKGAWNGEGTLNATVKTDGKTRKYALNLETLADAGALDVMYKQDGLTYLRGDMHISPAKKVSASAPETSGDMQHVVQSLALRVLSILQAEAPEGMQVLLHYLSGNNYLDGGATNLRLPGEEM